MLALVLLAGTLFLAVTMVLAWLVYTVATLRSEVAYISEVNKVIDHVNALAHGVQQAHYRSTTRIDRADALAAAANEKGVEVDSRVDTLLDRINEQATKARRNSDKIDEVEAAADGAAANTQINTDAVGQQGARITDLEGEMGGLVSTEDLDERLGAYVRTDDLPDQDLGGYAKWTDFDERDVTTKSLRSGALELTGDSAEQIGTLTYDGEGLTLVSGIGNPATRIGPSSLAFGANSLSIDEDGDLSYCKGAAPCQKLQTA